MGKWTFDHINAQLQFRQSHIISEKVRLTVLEMYIPQSLDQSPTNGTTPQSGARETGSLKLLGPGIWRTFRRSPSAYCDNKPRQVGLNYKYSMTFSISSREYQYSPLTIRICCSKREPFCGLLPLLRRVVPLNDEHCHLIMPVGSGRCARDALHHTFNIGVYISVKSILLQ